MPFPFWDIDFCTLVYGLIIRNTLAWPLGLRNCFNSPVKTQMSATQDWRPYRYSLLTMKQFQLTSMIPNLELSPQQWRTKLINTNTFNTGQLGDLVVPSNLTLTILESWLCLQNNKSWCWGWKCCFPSIALSCRSYHVKASQWFWKFLLASQDISPISVDDYVERRKRIFQELVEDVPHVEKKPLGMICSKGQSDRRFMLQNGAQGLLRIDVYRNNMK